MAKNKLHYDITAKDKTSQAFDKVSRRLGGMKRELVGIKTAIAGAFIVGGAVALSRMAKEAADAGDAIAKTSRNIGVTSEMLQEMRHAADLSGVSVSTLESSMTAFVKRLGEAKAGTGPLVSGLKGIDGELLKQIQSSGNVEEALSHVADAMKNAGTAADRARIANAAFSRAGIPMVEMLRDGSAALNEMRNEAVDLGLVIDADLIAGAERMNDELARSQKIITTQLNEAFLSLAPAISKVAEKFAEAANQAASWYQSTLPIAERNSKSLIETYDKLIAKRDEILDKFGPPKTDVDKDLMGRAAERITAVLNLLESRGYALDENGNLVRAVESKKTDKPKEDPFAKTEKRLKELERAGQRVKRAVEMPMESLNKELALLDELLEEKEITWEEYGRAVDQAWDKVETKTESANDNIKSKSEETWTKVGDGIEDFAKRGELSLESFKSTAFDILEDIARAWLSKMLDLPAPGSKGGGGFEIPNIDFGGIGDFFGFAKGGVMTPNGPRSLPRFAGGGISNTPAIFGEAGPEAAVPLPDGRSIPVKMQGGGGTVVNFNIDARGAEVGVEERIDAVLRQRWPEMKNDAVSSSVGAVNSMAGRGGAFAKSMGRR
jgi:hypothetical protein